jgi:hypothetical protein
LSSTIGRLSADRYFIYRCFNQDILFRLCHRPAIVNLAHTPGDTRAARRGTRNVGVCWWFFWGYANAKMLRSAS